MGLAWLLGLAQLGASPLTAGPRDEVQAAALQRLREVFDIEELPPDVLPRKKPPQFMVDLFNKVADANGITRAPGLLEGDVVRSFEDRAPVERDRFFFDVSAMERGEQVLKAELRVFKLRRRRVARRADPQHFCKVEVYELLEGGSNPLKKNLIASRLLSLYSEGWEVFNVTQTVSKWVGSSNSNHGFLITATHLLSNRIEHNLVAFAKGQGNLQESRNALLVLFTNSNKRRSSSFVPSSTNELKSLNLLYFDDKENVVLKNYRDMVATRLFLMLDLFTQTRGGTGEIPSHDPPQFPHHFPGVPTSRGNIYERRARRDVGRAVTAALLTGKGVTPRFSRQDAAHSAQPSNAGRGAELSVVLKRAPGFRSPEDGHPRLPSFNF
ncbi:uncharacterized protein LOC116238163 [Phasianus colchicus]|uniref:uncharacterized protein LOC116238163 n=1 Tax=Phasianus colchicus TaxID=9054 RepID=UPI00129EE89C|nr:uncharacterized protein LOC116238163 [Phasianus colchicus]